MGGDDLSLVTRPTPAQIARLVRRQLLASRPTLFTVVMGFAGPLLLYAMYLGMARKSPLPDTVIAIFGEQGFLALLRARLGAKAAIR